MDAIIFDLDGTLWDPSDTCLKAWEIATRDIPFIERPVTRGELSSVFGMQHDLIGEALFPGLTPKQRNQVIEACYAKEVELLSQEGGTLYPGVEQVLKELSMGYPLYMVSNCQQGYMEAFHAYHGMEEFFEDRECSGNTGKPKSYNIGDIIQRNKLRDPIYIGDTQGDKEASEANQIPFVFAEYGFGVVETAELRIQAPKDLISLVVNEN